MAEFEFLSDYAVCSKIFLTEEKSFDPLLCHHPCLFVFPFSIIIFSYSYVYKAIRQHNRNVSPSFRSTVNQAIIAAVQEIGSVEHSLLATDMGHCSCQAAATNSNITQKLYKMKSNLQYLKFSELLEKFREIKLCIQIFTLHNATRFKASAKAVLPKTR